MSVSTEGFIYVIVGISIIIFLGLIFVILLNISDKEAEKEEKLKKSNRKLTRGKKVPKAR